MTDYSPVTSYGHNWAGIAFAVAVLAFLVIAALASELSLDSHLPYSVTKRRHR